MKCPLNQHAKKKPAGGEEQSEKKKKRDLSAQVAAQPVYIADLNAHTHALHDSIRIRYGSNTINQFFF